MTMLARILIVIALLFPAVALADDAGVSDTATVTALPDAATAPLDAGSFAWKLYKAGHLVPALILLAFFALKFAERRFAWLRNGTRKLVVASLLASLGMLAERAASGTTPNFVMVVGALGAAIAMWTRTHGSPLPLEKA